MNLVKFLEKNKKLHI
jgi:hypothetical protein